MNVIFTYGLHFYVVDGVDFIGLTREIAFTGSDQTYCVNITILSDTINELDERFLLELTLQYAPFDIPIRRINVTILELGKLHVYCTRTLLILILDSQV